MRSTTTTILLLACTGLGACSPPGPPEEERRPAPQAAAKHEVKPRTASVRAAETYKDRAGDAAAAARDAVERQRAAIDPQAR